MADKSKYRHTKHLLPFYRRNGFAIFSTLALILAGFLILPEIGTGEAPFKQLRLWIYALMIFAWLGNILADTLKPLWLHILVTAATVTAFVAGLFAYIGVAVKDLRHIFFNFSVMKGMWPLIFEGLSTTIMLALSSALFATLIGLLVAVLRLLKNKTLDIFLKIYLEFFRTMPILVILLVVYFGFPFLNLSMGPFASAVLVLSFTNGAFISEDFRAGISSIHHTQTEAAYALGLSFSQTMRLVLVPQAFRIVFPPLTNRWIGVLKDTAVCSFIAIRELLKTSQMITTQRANPTPLVVATGLFLAMLIPLTMLATRLERRSKNPKAAA